MSGIDPLMPEYNMNYSQRLSPYRAVNTLSLLQQDRQCMYNVTLRRVSVPVVARKSVLHLLHFLHVCL